MWESGCLRQGLPAAGNADVRHAAAAVHQLANCLLSQTSCSRPYPTCIADSSAAASLPATRCAWATCSRPSEACIKRRQPKW